MRDQSTLPRKPTRADLARSRGPTTPAGKARSARNSTRHGLRARALAPVAALGERQAVLDAHLAAYRRELHAPGPYARDLAEAVACAQLRAARAEWLEAQLLARAAEDGGDLSAPDRRAAWALVLRYRREAELSAKRARQELEALARARAAGLLPGEDEAAEAERELDEALAAFSPNEPSPRKAEPEQELAAAPEPANDDAAPNEPEPADDVPNEPEPDPEPVPSSRPDRELPLLLGPMRAYAAYDRAALARFCATLSPGKRLKARAMLALLERKARERGHEPEPWLRPAADAIDGTDAVGGIEGA